LFSVPSTGGTVGPSVTVPQGMSPLSTLIIGAPQVSNHCADEGIVIRDSLGRDVASSSSGGIYQFLLLTNIHIDMPSEGLNSTRTSQSPSDEQTVSTSDFRDGDELGSVGASSSFLTALAPSLQENQVNDLPLLPEIPDSSPFNCNLDQFDMPSRDNIRQERATILTTVATNVREGQNSESEIVKSPTRTLFPSRPHESRINAVSTIESKGSITHAKAASLRREIEKLKEDRDHWQNEYEDKARELEEERRKRSEFEMRLKSVANLGLDL